MLTSYSKTETRYAYAWCSQVYLKCDQVARVQLEACGYASFPGYMYMVWVPGNEAVLVVASFSGYMVWAPGNEAILVICGSSNSYHEKPSCIYIRIHVLQTKLHIKIIYGNNKLILRTTLILANKQQIFSSVKLLLVLHSLSLGAHGTGQFFLWVVGWAGKTIAGSLSGVEQSTISIPSTAWYALWVLVNTLKGLSVIVAASCHEVAVVLESPGGWTLGFGREHQHHHSGSSWADRARDIVVGDWCYCSCSLVLSSIDRAVSLHTSRVVQVVRTLRQAEVVGASSFVIVPAPSSPSCVDQLCSWCVGAGCSSPASVHHPSTAGARRSRWARVTLLSLVPFSPSLPSLPADPEGPGTPSRPSRPRNTST